MLSIVAHDLVNNYSDNKFLFDDEILQLLGSWEKVF